MGTEGDNGVKDTLNVLYLIAFALYAIGYYLNKTTIDAIGIVTMDTVFDVCRLTSAIILICKLFTQRLELVQMLGLAMCLAIVLSSFYVNRDWNILLLFLFIVAGDGIDVKSLSHVALVITLSVIAVAVLLSSTGDIEAVYTYRVVDGVYNLRSSLGFTHPNQFGQAVLVCCCSYGVLRFGHYRLIDTIPHLVGVWACYKYADSRTTVLCILFMMAMLVVMNYESRLPDQTLVAVASFVVVVGAIALSYYMMLHYSPGKQLMVILDNTVSSRFSRAQIYYESFRPTVLGRPVGTIEHIFGTIVQKGPDNAYVRMLLQDGWVVTAIFITMYVMTMISYAKNRYFDVCAFGLLIYAIVAIMESNSLHFSANYFLIGMANVIYGRRMPTE